MLCAEATSVEVNIPSKSAKLGKTVKKATFKLLAFSIHFPHFSSYLVRMYVPSDTGYKKHILVNVHRNTVQAGFPIN